MESELAFFCFEKKKEKRCYGRYSTRVGFFKSAQIGQYLPVASVSAHLLQINLPHSAQRLFPVVGFPQSSQGSSAISMVILAFALCSLSIPTIFARVARSNSLASNHSIAQSSMAIKLQPNIPIAEIFLCLFFIIASKRFTPFHPLTHSEVIPTLVIYKNYRIRNWSNAEILLSQYQKHDLMKIAWYKYEDFQ